MLRVYTLAPLAHCGGVFLFPLLLRLDQSLRLRRLCLREASSKQGASSEAKDFGRRLSAQEHRGQRKNNFPASGIVVP
jgi:hypothetical protein